MSLDRRRSKVDLSALLRRSVPARLSQLAPPPPTVDDVTRREFLIGAAGLLLLPAGCGSGREDGGEAPGQTRTVRHALGETRIPENPRRMVVLDVVTLEHVLALRMMPVGYPLDGGAPPPYLESMLDGVESVGTIGEPSLERIAVLEPDLIVGWDEFFVEDDEESNEALDEVEASPLWDQPRAVQEGRVYNVDINPWLEGSVTGARLVLDDLEKHLAGGN
jgi:ABC-type Fe3+-hydroxamate transport system substrate-binding protein